MCPPHAAVEVAREVLAAGFRGVYVDANAVSPATARELAGAAAGAGASFVDGGIVGAPPDQPGTSRLYLSGPGADKVAELFAGTALEARVVGGQAGAASSVKMAYAAWTKGTSALLLAARALARAEGVEDALLGEWDRSQPALVERSQGAARSAAAKGWRWAGEMEEIAASMAAVALPDGFHRAAAEIYRRFPRPAAGGGTPAAGAGRGPARPAPAQDGPTQDGPAQDGPAVVLDRLLGRDLTGR